MERFLQYFSISRPAVIAMIHVQALPGTPKNHLSMEGIVEKATHEAQVYKKCGVDAIMVENMHDVPYMTPDKIGPEITACMTAVCKQVKSVFGGPVGVQILAGANKQALSVSLAAGLQFMRAECFVYSHVADEGLMNACAGELMRYRKHIGAENVLVFTDIKKKHSSHSITADVSIEETASAAEMFLSDGVIVTGTCTGKSADPTELTRVKKCTRLPVLIGSGITLSNCLEYQTADAWIVGSHFKQDGLWSNDINIETVNEFMKKVKTINSSL